MGGTSSKARPAAAPRKVTWKPSDIVEPVEVPEWATKAGLHARYRQLAEQFDEFTAASQCRRIKAERGQC